MPRASSFVVLLESLRVIRELRAGRGAGLDRFYLGNLGAPDAALNDRQLDSDIVPEVIGKLVHELRECPHPSLAIFVGRNLYVALRDEVLPDLMALNRALEPHLDTCSALLPGGIGYESGVRYGYAQWFHAHAVYFYDVGWRPPSANLHWRG